MTQYMPDPERFLGEQFPQDEVPDDSPNVRCYAYFAPHGKAPDQVDEIHHLDSEIPHYPTPKILSVELEETDGGQYEIVRAKNMDLSDHSASFEWVEE